MLKLIFIILVTLFLLMNLSVNTAQVLVGVKQRTFFRGSSLRTLAYFVILILFYVVLCLFM